MPGLYAAPNFRPIVAFRPADENAYDTSQTVLYAPERLPEEG